MRGRDARRQRHRRHARTHRCAARPARRWAPRRAAALRIDARLPVVPHASCRHDAPLRVALADDQALVRAGLRALLQQPRHRKSRVEADDGEALLARLADDPGRRDPQRHPHARPRRHRGAAAIARARRRHAGVAAHHLRRQRPAAARHRCRRAGLPAQGCRARRPARRDRARRRRRDAAAAGEHRSGARAFPLPRRGAADRHLQRPRGRDPAPARRRLFQQGDRTQRCSSPRAR